MLIGGLAAQTHGNTRTTAVVDLIRMKLARGRPVDRADVAALTDPEAEQPGR